MEKIPLIIAGLYILFLLFMISRYRRCPADKLMVIYGKVGKDNSGKPLDFVCIYGGASFIYPIIQRYEFLDISPIKIELNLKNTLSKNNVSMDIHSIFTIGISIQKGVRENAVIHLMGLSHEKIQELSKNILIEIISSLVNSKDTEEIKINKDEFISEVVGKVTEEFKKIGINVINYHFNQIDTTRY